MTEISYAKTRKAVKDKGRSWNDSLEKKEGLQIKYGIEIFLWELLTLYIGKNNDKKLYEGVWMETSTALLAKTSDRSTKTIQRYIRTLLTAGILIEKVRLGHERNNNYSIRFNDDLLIRIEKKKAAKTAADSSKTKVKKSPQEQPKIKATTEKTSPEKSAVKPLTKEEVEQIAADLAAEVITENDLPFDPDEEPLFWEYYTNAKLKKSPPPI